MSGKTKGTKKKPKSMAKVGRNRAQVRPVSAILYECSDCSDLFSLEHLYPNKGVCDVCISGVSHVSSLDRKNYPVKESVSRDKQIAMSVNRLFDYSDEWLDDEPWRKW